MSLGNWEGKTSDEAEPEELPDFDAIKFLRLMGLRNYLTPFCIYMQKSVLFCFKGKSFWINVEITWEMDVVKGEKICKEKVIDIYTDWFKFFV